LTVNKAGNISPRSRAHNQNCTLLSLYVQCKTYQVWLSIEVGHIRFVRKSVSFLWYDVVGVLGRTTDQGAAIVRDTPSVASNLTGQSHAWFASMGGRVFDRQGGGERVRLNCD
jgi:hypothetical protein